MTPLQIVGAFVSLATAAGIIIGWFLSFNKMTKRFQDLERHTKENYNTNKVLCEAVLQILIHFRTGNSYDSMRKTEEKLVEHLSHK